MPGDCAPAQARAQLCHPRLLAAIAAVAQHCG